MSKRVANSRARTRVGKASASRSVSGRSKVDRSANSRKGPSSGSIVANVPTRLWWALAIVVLFHGGLLLSGTFRGTYDAYVHIFLGDHYQRDWFSTWDQRWYTGFTTVSYPPGTHMSIAALAKLTGSLEMAFVLVQVSSLLLLTVGVYRFSRLWVDEEAAANAALLLVVSSSVAETVHLFGQLPTTFALAFLLNALPSIRSWVFGGRLTDLAVGTVVLAACTAGHHVTTLFGSVFFLGPVLAAGLLEQSRCPRDDEPFRGDPAIVRSTVLPLAARRLRRIWPATVRIGVLAPCLVGVLVLVVLPYWIWSGADPINQIPIPHGSRGDFLADLNLGLVFFFLPWGLLLLVLPYALVRAVVDRMWPLAASIFLLFVLGTGGTTPVPKLLLGPAFDILTLDRFTFWATVQILPLAGLFVTSLESGTVAQWLRRVGGPLLHKGALIGFIGASLALCLFASTLSRYRPFQPDPIDPDPIVAFLEKDQHERWRFLTLGFGDQMAWLSAQTTATQVDGNYHSVRRLPELTSTSVERLEGAKYRGVSGLGSLQQFLEVPEKYHLKFVFSNDEFYDPLLHFLGWQRLGPLENGIVVWEKNDIEPLPAVLPVREVPPWQRFMWGTVPPLMIMAALGLLLWSLWGRPGWQRKPDATLAFVVGPFAAIDRNLRRSLGDDVGEAATRAPSLVVRPGLAMLRQHFRQPIARRHRVVMLAGLACVLAAPVWLFTADTNEPQATDVIEAYYEHLDFRRWQDAYQLLDPVARPDYELWRLQLSVEGGILASYAKLDSLETKQREPSSNTVLAANETLIDVDLRYLTALDWYVVDREHLMVEREGRWFLVPDEPDLIVPPDQLVRRTSVDYLIQGRRRVTSLTSELTDIQDRPQLDVRGVRLVERDGLPVVVGQVVNVDVDPADLTITAVLRDEDGAELARYNATDHMLRTLNPRESTPFRIDFEEVAAGVDPDFDPLDFSPIELDNDIASVEVYAKAVVTQSGLSRDVQINSVAMVSGPGESGWALQGELRNDGVSEAVVPMILVSYLDESGDVLWVDRSFVETAIRSQRSASFVVELASVAVVGQPDAAISVFANGLDPEPASHGDYHWLVAAPDGAAYSSIRVDVVAMLPTGDG